jgi:hypothetical protein
MGCHIITTSRRSNPDPNFTKLGEGSVPALMNNNIVEKEATISKR